MVLMLLILVLAAPAHAGSDDPDEADRLLVYCLAARQRADLAAAATTLGLVSPGSAPEEVRLAGRPLTLERWRTLRPGDFDRACRALAAADPDLREPESPGPLAAMLSVLIPVIAGALLTLATTEWRAAAGAGAQTGNELFDAATVFAAAHAVFLVGWRRGDADVAALESARETLAAKIGNAALARPSWTEPARLLAMLGGLTARSENDWRKVPMELRAEIARREAASAAAFTARTAAMAVRLRRPWLRHSAMRRPATPGAAS
ncbi:hypothetical protein DP939_32670 [Spongiactinospora rosea]|uniref:Uncharacterized protein n=2 Tax=Spongiactinospora rosea TaxID=2248750 RepID=A0A366LQ93_9ACTN|nr:hypothetical protein DP939_32670 [Spongiactinospora rosea]